MPVRQLTHRPLVHRQLARRRGSLLVAAVLVVLAAACTADPAPTDPALVAFQGNVSVLTAGESGWCRQAQQQLVGLDDATLPLAAIDNVMHSVWADFVSSKATLTPLQTQTWAAAGVVTGPGGSPVSLTHRISCKMRSADHLATASYPTQPDLECKVLNERSLALAWDRLSADEKARFEASGRPIVLDDDRLELAGPGWLNPIDDEIVAGDALHLTAHALRIDFNDPAYASYPETVRGVHYCTTWSPAWAYGYYRVGAFQP